MLVLLNGERALGCELVRPLGGGVWQVTLATLGAVPTGRVSLDIDGKLTLSGTATRAGDFEGRASTRIVAGAGGLTKLVEPNEYQQTTLRVIAQNTLSTVGETLSPTADAGVVSAKVDRWVRPGTKAAAAIASLVARVAGATWRMLPDGSMWIGVPTFPSRKFDYELLERDPVTRRLVFITDDPTLDAGVSVDGYKIVHVRTTIEHARVRTEAYYL